MTSSLSLRQLGQAAVAMLETDQRETVATVAGQLGISPETVYRYWREAHPDRPPRGYASDKSRKFALTCEVVYARIIEPSTFGELFASTRAWIPGLQERTMHRALRKLIDDGRVVRNGKPRGGGTYARSQP